MALMLFKIIAKNKETHEIEVVEEWANNLKEARENVEKQGYEFIREKLFYEEYENEVKGE